MITYEEFQKLELKTAKVIEVKEHPSADRLYILQIEIGEKKRQIIAGIREAYSADELIGRDVIVIVNLEPALIRGEESQGMLLAAKSGGNLSILTLDRTLPSGTTVK